MLDLDDHVVSIVKYLQLPVALSAEVADEWTMCNIYIVSDISKTCLVTSLTL